MYKDVLFFFNFFFQILPNEKICRNMFLMFFFEREYMFFHKKIPSNENICTNVRNYFFQNFSTRKYVYIYIFFFTKRK